jgi:hypothetical protein
LSLLGAILLVEISNGTEHHHHVGNPEPSTPIPPGWNSWFIVKDVILRV